MHSQNGLKSIRNLNGCIIEYPNILVNYLVQVIRVKFVGSGALFVHGHPHFLKLLQNEIDALIHRHAMPEQSVYRLGKRVVLVIADTIGIEAKLQVMVGRKYAGSR